MTHYLTMSTMPTKNTEYMLDQLQRLGRFPVDKEFCKKYDLCTCKTDVKAFVREIRFYEMEIYTPASKAFEEWLEEWGFADIAKGNVMLQHKASMNKHYKNRPLMQKIHFRLKQKMMNMGFKLFYWLLNKGMGMSFAPFADYQTGEYGTQYIPFSPISKRYPMEIKQGEHKAQSHFNQRNMVIGKMIEHPCGSWGKEGCDKCGAQKGSLD